LISFKRLHPDDKVGNSHVMPRGIEQVATYYFLSNGLDWRRSPLGVRKPAREQWHSEKHNNSDTQNSDLHFCTSINLTNSVS
jgi:hypothetical protein